MKNITNIITNTIGERMVEPIVEMQSHLDEDEKLRRAKSNFYRKVITHIDNDIRVDIKLFNVRTSNIVK